MKRALESENHILAPQVRRLFYESYTLFAADIRNQLERRDDDAPKRLVAPEREARRTRVADRVKPMRLVGELNVSHALVDSVVHMVELNTLGYISIEKCTNREQEMRGQKKVPQLEPDANGYFRLKKVDLDPYIEVGIDLKLKYAFQRRGLALDMGGAMAFEVHELLVEAYFEAMAEEPPKGYARVEADQILRADAKTFCLLSEMTRNGIRPTPGGVLPLDDALQKLLTMSKFQLLLTPLVGSSKKRKFNKDEQSSSSSNGPKTVRRRKKQRKQTKKETSEKPRQQVEPQLMQDYKNKFSKGKSDSKGKGKGLGPNMPPELRGHAYQTGDGVSICFGFNTGNCNRVKPGEKCPRGLHVCCFKGCEKNHSLKSH